MSKSVLPLCFITVCLLNGVRTAERLHGSQPESTLELIEREQGGRHWVDAPTAPPKSPERSLKTLRVEPGLQIQLFAAEPLVRDPVAITFDHQGRMYVVEYGDYPTGPEDGGEPLSRVVYLEDTDHDGTADRRHVFADKLNFAHSLMPLDDGLLVAAQTRLLFLKDTDGDHAADVREVWFDGFTPAHPQMQVGNPRWGIDNWIYLNYGPGEITSSIAPDNRITMPRKDIRFHPATMRLEPDSGLGQFGNTVDRWGNRFYCTNRNPIMTTLLPPAVLQRNPHAVISTGHYDVGKSGGDTRVYPLVQMKSNYLSHAGTHTSACGVTAYVGDLLGPDYANSVFVCEPIGHLVTRSIVAPSGVTLNARRARHKADFITSTDTWFRPSSLANGPDGALYLADMYRLWVEHPKFLPPEIAAKLDWRAGEDRGRIYRIVPEDAESLHSRPRSFKTPTDTITTVELLEDPNGWRQFLGQRLLVRGRTTEAIPHLQSMLKESDRATARLHALWTLNGLGGLTSDDVVGALDDVDAHVRCDAVKLASSWLDNTSVFQQLAKHARDADARVRLQVVVTLGETSRSEATPLLIELARRDGRNAWFARALLSSAETRAGAILDGLIDDDQFLTHADIGAVDLLRQLAAAVGARGDMEELDTVLRAVTSQRPSGMWWRAAVINGLGQGLPRHRGKLGRTSLLKLIAAPPNQLAVPVAAIGRLLDQSQEIALDRSRSTPDRVAAAQLLAYRPFRRTADAFEKLLRSNQPVDLQRAVIDALSANGSEAAARVVLDHWSELGPTIRGPALTLLLRRVSTTRLMLEAMAAGNMRSAVLSIDQRVRLLNHSDAELKKLASRLFGGVLTTDRRQVAQRYQHALSLEASAEAGARVFRKTCANCHRIDGMGYQVGPDISDVRNRSRTALLYDILDPNAKVEPRFTSYTVATRDGRVFNGLIVSETAEAVVLRMAEGKEQAIGRGEIAEIRASQLSLMPEGVEKDISHQDMANLLEFLKN